MAKSTVDDYKSIDIRWLVRRGLISDVQRWELLTWSISGRETGSINIMADDTKIRFSYTCNKTEQMDYIVKLDKTPCHYGGVRYWFICPKCFRRVAKLYGGKYFLCRLCHDLTYESCQKHDKRISLLAKNPGILLSEMRKFLDRNIDDYSLKDSSKFFFYSKALDYCDKKRR